MNNPIATIRIIAVSMIALMFLITFGNIARAEQASTQSPTMAFSHPAGLHLADTVFIYPPQLVIDPNYGVLNINPYYRVDFSSVKHTQKKEPSFEIFAPFTARIESIKDQGNGQSKITLSALVRGADILAHFYAITLESSLTIGDHVLEGEPIGHVTTKTANIAFTDRAGLPVQADFQSARLIQNIAYYNVIARTGYYAQLTIGAAGDEALCRQYQNQLNGNYQTALAMGAYPPGTSFMQWCLDTGAASVFDPERYANLQNRECSALDGLVNPNCPRPSGNLTQEQINQLVGRPMQQERNPVNYPGRSVQQPARQGAYSHPDIRPDNLVNAAANMDPEQCPEEVYVSLAAAQEENISRNQAIVNNTVRPPGDFHDQACYDIFAAQITGPVASIFSGVNGALTSVFDRMIGSVDLRSVGITSADLRRQQRQMQQDNRQTMRAVSEQLSETACDTTRNVYGNLWEAGVSADPLYADYDTSHHISTNAPGLDQYAQPEQQDPATAGAVRSPQRLPAGTGD